MTAVETGGQNEFFLPGGTTSGVHHKLTIDRQDNKHPPIHIINTALGLQYMQHMSSLNLDYFCDPLLLQHTINDQNKNVWVHLSSRLLVICLANIIAVPTHHFLN